MQIRIYLSELTEKLRYKKIESVVTWCKNNGVSVHRDIGTNKRRFVFAEEFNRVYEKGLNKTISQTYSAMSLSSEYQSLQQPTKYVPKGEKEITFFTILTNLKKQP